MDMFTFGQRGNEIYELPPIIVTPGPDFSVDGTGLANELRRSQDVSTMGQRGDDAGGGTISVDIGKSDDNSAIEISLDSSDIAVLREVARLEKAAGATSGLFTFGPLASLFTTNPAAFSFSVLSSDWAGHANAVTDLDRIKSCRISGVVGVHLVEVHGDKSAFFEDVYHTYHSACTL
jgi:hypothetical protein